MTDASLRSVAVAPVTRASRLAVLALLAAGCERAGGAGTAGWRTERETAGDTTIVRTVGAGEAAAPAELVEELRIGVLEGEDAYMLGGITSLAVAADGSIHAYDAQVPVLRQYDAEGRFVRAIGGPGEGPGEYRQVTGMAFMPDGRLVLWDPRLQRVSFFTPAGEAAGQWRVPSGLFTSHSLLVDTAGHVYVAATVSPMDETGRWEIGYWEYGTDGVPADTLTAPDYGYEPPMMVASAERRRSSASPPFTPGVHWLVHPHGHIVAGLSSEYRIDILRDDGTVLRIVKEQPPVPVQPEERAEREANLEFSMRGVDPGWRWTGPRTPAVKPYFQGLTVGDDGRLWVRVHAPAEHDPPEEPPRPGPDGRTRPVMEWREPTLYDVYEADGVYAGRVRVPDRTSIEVMRGDRVWGTARDSLDVQTIRRYRIDWNGR